MNIGIVFVVLAVLCAFGSVFTGVRIANDLKARGLSAHPALVRWMIFKYMADYRRITLKEEGKVGPLYHQCATLSALAALFALCFLLIKFI